MPVKASPRCSSCLILSQSPVLFPCQKRKLSKAAFLVEQCPLIKLRNHPHIEHLKILFLPLFLFRCIFRSGCFRLRSAVNPCFWKLPSVFSLWMPWQQLTTQAALVPTFLALCRPADEPLLPLMFVLPIRDLLRRRLGSRPVWTWLMPRRMRHNVKLVGRTKNKLSLA